MELTIISLIVSALVACIQIWSFLDGRNEKKENKLNVFSKASDVKKELDEIKAEMLLTSTNNDETAKIHSEKLQKLETCQAVLKERMDNTIEGLDKIDQKMDKILERV